MHKYLLLLKLTWENSLVYRTSLIIWRVQQFLSTIMSLTLWTVIFSGGGQVFGYERSQMISYVFLVSALQSVILATNLHGLAGTIYSGDLTNVLLKPLKIFWYFGVQDVADKLKNFSFIILETIILYFIFKPELVIPPLPIFLLFLVWVLCGAMVNFFITLLFGSLGFWSNETWGPRFLFFMIIDFTAGKLFPLDILPSVIRQALYFTPFPYLSYAQIQLFLGRLSPTDIILNSLVLAGWVIGLGVAARLVWRRGLKDYAAAGM